VLRAISFKARWCVIPALALYTCLGVGSAAANTDDAMTRANRMAYDIAMKCFVANGVARGNSRDAGDTAQAAVYEAKARRSFNAASNLGDALKYSDKRVNQDFGLAQTQELPKMVRDGAYLRQTLAICETGGL
jgi:hypothetical protein